MKKKLDHKALFSGILTAMVTLQLMTGCAAVPQNAENSAVTQIPAEEPEATAPAPELSNDGETAAAGEETAAASAEASVEGPYGRITVSLPAGWNSVPVPPGSAEPLINGDYGLILTPEKAKTGHLELFYNGMFGVCGTGLEETETELAGDRAMIGTYDGHAMWDFIVFKGMNEGVQAISSGTDSWPEEIREEAMRILDTLRFEPELASGGAGYFQPESEETAIGLMVEASDITDTGAAVRFRIYDPEAADGELSYGSWFVLERKDGDQWTALPQLIEEAAFTDEAYPIPAGDAGQDPDGMAESVCQANWEWLYGKIGPGDYRIGKQVIDLRGPGDFDSYTLYACFRYAGEPVRVPIGVALPAEEGEMDPQAWLESEEHWNWWDDMREKIERSAAVQDGMPAYYTAVMEKLLASEDGENTVCSPLNIYLALAMLAEVSDGETRQQVLNVLQVEDTEALRERADALFTANHSDTPLLKSLPAASMWLRNDIGYDEETLGRLSDSYHAESFTGRPGSEEMNEQLRAWTDEKTGGLLSEYTKDLKLERETVLALLTTMYYKAAWVEKFRPEATDRGVFHGMLKDTETDMMHRSFATTLYRADGFSAVGLPLNDSGTMYFILPEEGADPDTVLSSPALCGLISVPAEEAGLESVYALVEMTVPKFSVHARTDLTGTLKELGITDAFDPLAADFSPLTDEADSIYVSKAEHAAVVEIDEEGVTGAAYTELAMAAGAAMMPETVEFILDRPFCFMVTARDGSVLFAGCVRNCEESAE